MLKMLRLSENVLLQHCMFKLDIHLNTTTAQFWALMSLVVRKPAFCICENKDVDQLRGNSEADQRLRFRYTGNTIPLLHKSEISSCLLWLYSPVCVGPGRKPRRPVFSKRGSNNHEVKNV